MASGWAPEGAVQDQIDSTVEDALQRIRNNRPAGESRRQCEDCGEDIPQARREAVPGVRLCVTCQSEHDREAARNASFAGYNRRGSKDSQLR